MSLPRLATRLLCFVVAILLLCAGAASAQNTINVPANQPTIQAAINAANNGDTVLVAPGTYVENLNFNGKAITVTSSGGPAVTIVDGNAAAAVVTFMTNEGSGSVLSGFTLRNGTARYAWPTWGSGGGIFIYYASPTITNNVITGNRADVGGIGIEIQGGSALIRANTITGNTWGGGYCCGDGGGIEVRGDTDHPTATPLIIGNTITNNSIWGGGFGGGISAGYLSSPTIQNNYIAGNNAYNGGGGISLTSYDAPIVVQNIIVNNSAGSGGSGGGMYAQGAESSADVIINNTIVGNSAFDGSSGIYVYLLSAVISNNIVVAASGQNGIVCAPYTSTFPNFSHNDVIAPSGQVWSSNCAGFSQSNGNISADPMFVNAANGNYHLQAGSPAIDAGDNNVPNLPQQDYAGNPRILDGNNDCVGKIDLGAYELPNPAGPANLRFSASYLSFPEQVIGTSSSPQGVTLTNSGAGCFQFAPTQITGDFSQTNTCPSAGLAGSSSCVYSVTFTPTGRGSRAGALTVSGSDGVSNNSKTVSLNGTGLTPPAVSLSPATINFGYVPLGGNSVQTVTLTNTGQASLNIYNVSTAPPFADYNTCPASLDGGGSCFITVYFTPTVAGLKSGLLTISDNAAGSPHTMSLSGAGTDFSVSPSPASGTVKRPQSIQLTVNVTPVGGPYNPGVSLSCAGLPSYAGCTFAPATVTPGASGANSTLTISTTAKTPRGTYTVWIIGQSGSLQHTATISLTVK